MNRCPELEHWIAFHTGELDEVQSNKSEAHLSSCDTCRALLEKLRDHDALANRLREAVAFSERHVPTPPATTGAVPAVGRDDIDEYNIIGEISRTHFSIVYEATQKGTGQRVALKVLLASAAADDRGRLRFEREVELLALLQHPNIVPIYNSGLYGGQYYFVMPYIKGEAPDAFADEASLSLPERVDLIHTICVAVNYAHQRGVMHRDLKPSNILVDEVGDVHILDFGLAKITSEQRRQSEATLTLDSGQIIGTPAYMSPEQADGRTNDIDIRSDVYSLGVIMYLVFVGRMPYTVDAGLTQTLKHIQITEPARPTVIDHAFNRELEAIILKSLEKEPDRRYQSAGALAEDLHRFLTHQPVLARSPSALYHFRKLVARHTVPFALLALVFVLLAGFSINAKIQADLTAAARDKEAAAGEREKAAKDFFLDNMIRSVSPDLGRGPDVTVHQMFDDIAEQVETGFANQPLFKAEIQDAIGLMSKELRKLDKAETNLRRALKTRRRILGDDHEDVATTRHNLAAVLYFKEHYDEAEQLYLKALATRRSIFGARSLQVAETLNHLAAVSLKRPDLKKAESRYSAALEIRKAILGDDHPDVADVYNNLGYVLREAGRYEEAKGYIRRALDIFTHVHAGAHPDTATTMQNMARCLSIKGDREEAKEFFQKSIRMKRELFEPDDPRIAVSLHWLADSIYADGNGNLGEAEMYCRQSLDIIRRRPPGSTLSRSLVLLGSILTDQGSPSAAIPVLAEGLGIRCTLPRVGTEQLEEDRTRLARCMEAIGDDSATEATFLAAYNSDGDTREQRRQSLYRLVGYYTAIENHAEAKRFADKLARDRRPADSSTPSTLSGIN